MPSLSQISNNFFINLITRLGVRPPPSEAFLLSNIVQPVSIVDSDITLSAIATSQTLDTPFTTGLQAAPGAGVLLADSGAQVAGTYQVFITFGSTNAVGACDIIIERRNAANAANIWRQVFTVNQAGGSVFTLSIRVVLSLNERIRCETAIGGAGFTGECNLWIQAA